MLTHPLIICCFDAIAVWYTFNLYDFLSMMPINPNRLLYHNASIILVFVLFPNIFYFLVGILYVFAT